MSFIDYAPFEWQRVEGRHGKTNYIELVLTSNLHASFPLLHIEGLNSVAKD